MTSSWRPGDREEARDGPLAMPDVQGPLGEPPVDHGDERLGQPGAGGRGHLVREFRGGKLLALAVNVVQNGGDWRELSPDLRCLAGEASDGASSRRRDRRRGHDPVYTMLEQLYGEVLRANRGFDARG